jgi:hypothetical protein
MKSKSKKVSRKSTVVSLLSMLVCLTFLAGGAFAHPPSDIALSYDGVSQILKVGITHASKSPDKHYIKKVEITKNGAVVYAEDYKIQPEAPSFSYDYKIDIAAGDAVEVKVSCSVFGSKKKKLEAGLSK